MFKVNDTVQVKILKLDREKEKVALGYKQLLPDPWSTVTEVYPVNTKLKGKVSSVTDYGAFIELEPGVEGLVHVSEMSWSKRSKSPKKLLNAGEEIEVQVLGIDTHDRRISLGMKQLQENPWETIASRYRVGSTIRGRVRNLTDFGAFVEVEEGVDGLVHVSDISHSKKIKHPKDVLKRDQEVEAVITNIDTRERRMSLSIKELTPSAWETFITTHKPGDLVRGQVSRFAGFGVFVQLGEDLEGLCHISELSDERVERPEDVVAIGQEMDFKILRIEHEDQKIGLSARAVGKEEEPTVDSKMYSTEAKGGMASLGELMNLKRGGKTGEEETKDEPKLSKKERKAQQAIEKSLQDSAAADSQETASEDNKEDVLPANDAAKTSEAVAEIGDENSSSEEASAEAGTFNDDSAESNPAQAEETATSSENEKAKTDLTTEITELTNTESKKGDQMENIPTENLEAESSSVVNAAENSAAENEVVNSEAKQDSEEKSAKS
jgi:ribosomal protein S1